MGLTTQYDTENIFAKILRNEVFAVKIFENDTTLSFMDMMPQSDGHVLVIPKTQTTNIFNLQSSTLASLIITVQKIAYAVQQAMRATGIIITQFNGTTAGQTVFHTHFHIIPSYDNSKIKTHNRQMEEQRILEKFAKKIKSHL